MNKNVNILGTGKKQWGCEFLNCNFSPKNQPTKQINLLTLTVSYEKSRLIKSKMKKTKQNKHKD